MNIYMVYYTEVNLICIVILLLFNNQLRNSSKKYSNGNRVFSLLIWNTIVLCLSDIFATILNGKDFPGARAFIEIINIVFYESMSVISFLWMLYVFIKFNMMKNINKSVLLLLIPLILFTIVALSNPITQFLFTIDENNLFHRNIATIFHWVVTWMYLVIPTLKITAAIIQEKNANKRKELTPFLNFIIAPIITGSIQMFFYGVTSTQVGITISIVLIFISEQSNKISLDALTRLNNRHAFDEYISSYIQHHTNSELTLLLIDVNNFKHINDRFGHVVGDCALCNVAEVLRETMYSTQKKLFVCRYGGDEFLVVAFDCNIEEMNLVKTRINEELEKMNQEHTLMYDLSVSIGLACGMPTDYEDVIDLLRIVDDDMYNEKEKYKFNNYMVN